MNDWEIIADNLKKGGWSLGWVSALDVQGRTIWIVDAHGYGKRFVVRADEMRTAFVELQRAIHELETYERLKTDCVLKPESAAAQNSIDTICRHLAEWRSR